MQCGLASPVSFVGSFAQQNPVPTAAILLVVAIAAYFVSRDRARCSALFLGPGILALTALLFGWFLLLSWLPFDHFAVPRLFEEVIFISFISYAYLLAPLQVSFALLLIGFGVVHLLRRKK